MEKVSDKYVYLLSNDTKFGGMLPLKLYIAMLYFGSEYLTDEINVNVDEIYEFLIECFIELSTRDKFDNIAFDVNVKNIYISAIPSINGPAKKNLVVYVENKKIMITELKCITQNNPSPAYLPAAKIENQKLIKIAMGVQKTVLRLFNNIVEECKSGKEALYESMYKHNKEKVNDKFNTNNFEKI